MSGPLELWTAILIAIVIMSNLNPPKLQPHIEQMVRCIDWTQAKGRT